LVFPTSDTEQTRNSKLHCAPEKECPILLVLTRKKLPDFNFVFGTNISDTTGHPMTVQVPASPSVCFCTTWGNQNKRNITFDSR